MGIETDLTSIEIDKLFEKEFDALSVEHKKIMISHILFLLGIPVSVLIVLFVVKTDEIDIWEKILPIVSSAILFAISLYGVRKTVDMLKKIDDERTQVTDKALSAGYFDNFDN